MIDPFFASDQEQAVDTMIALTHPSTLGGIIITGSESMELYLVLRRRGYNRVATPVTCRAPSTKEAARGRSGHGSECGGSACPSLSFSLHELQCCRSDRIPGW
jgi:hypothetical protein